MRIETVVVWVMAFACWNAAGHAGRTDANGGHRDSRTGVYHIHGGGGDPMSSVPMGRFGGEPMGIQFPEMPVYPLRRLSPNYTYPKMVQPDLDRPSTKTNLSTAEVDEGKEERVLAWLKERAIAGSPSAQMELGLRYISGNGVEKNEDVGRNWIKKAARQGESDAIVFLRNTDYSTPVRDPDGRISRSTSARKEFMRKTGYPKGRPGYVIDHIVPLKRGGSDSPENMQWQTIEDAKKKDKWE